MATQMVQRSTDWVINYGHNNTPDPAGDYRHFWVISYDTDKTNRLTKFTVDYYLQTHNTSYTSNTLDLHIPAGTATVYINNSSIGSCSNAATSTDKGDNYRLRYLGSKTFKIYHNDDGSASFKFRGTGFGISSGESTYSTPKNFPSIASPSIVGTVNTFDIDSGVSIPVTKYVSSYYDVLEISNGSNIFKTIENATNGFAVKTSTSIPVTFTSAELDDIYTKIPKGENATFTFKLTTYTNSGKTSKVGDSTKTATGNFTIQLPSVYGGICTDAFDSNVNLTGDTTKQTIIKGQSYINIAIPTNMQAVANTRKATIVEYVVDDVHIPYDANGVSKPLSTSNSSKDHVVIYAVDSRGTSSLPYTQKFTKYIDYNRVSLNTKNYKFERQNNGISRFIDTSFEGTWFSGNFGAKQNSLTPFVYYRVNEGQIWNDLNEFVDGASVGRLDMSKLDTSTPGVFKYNGPIMSAESDTGFDIKNSYDMFFGFRDELSNEGFTLTVNYGEPAAAIYKNKMALGGPYDEMLGGTQMWGDIYVNGAPLDAGGGSASAQRHALSAYLATPDTRSYAAWTTYQTRFNAYNSVGTKLTFDPDTNSIIVGPGVSKIKVSGCAFFCGKKSEDSNNSDYNVTLPATQLRVWCTVYDADNIGRDSTPAYLHHTAVNTNESVLVTEKIFTVGEGWRVDMCTQIGITSTATLLVRGTVLYAEVLE